MTRRVTIQTPLGQALQFRQLRGQESISELYELDIDLLSSDKGIDPKALAGQDRHRRSRDRRWGQTLHRRHRQPLRHAGAGLQPVQLQARRCGPGCGWPRCAATSASSRARPCPTSSKKCWASTATRCKRSSTRSYRAWDYCVQYHESDHNFIARLCEHEGIYYHYVHSAGQHTVVFCRRRRQQPRPAAWRGGHPLLPAREGCRCRQGMHPELASHASKCTPGAITTTTTTSKSPRPTCPT